MEEKKHVAVSIREGFNAGIPIVVGYFPVAMAFGLISKNLEISFVDCCLFSIFVYAGASQFMALDLIKAGISTGSIILATFLLNLRHMMMSASLSVKLSNIKKHWLLFIAFGVTDETFSVASLTDKKLNVPFLLAMQGISYSSWVLGSLVGYLVGAMLPDAIQSSLGIGLYAMFMALLVPEMKKASPILLLALLSGVIYVCISYLNVVPSSWNLILTIVISSFLGVILIKEKPMEVKA